MNTRKELRTGDAQYRATDHTPRQQHRTEPKTRTRWRYFVAALIAAALTTGIGAARAQVNTDLEALLVQQDRGWHATGNGTQIQSSSVDARALPIVAVWMRSPSAGARYGDWLHVKYLLHCEDRASLLYAVLDSGRIRTMESINGTPGIMEHPRPGSPAYLTMQAVCGLYGYQL